MESSKYNLSFLLKKMTAFLINRLDHLKLTILNIKQSCVFYVDGLEMKVHEFGEGRKALHSGEQKINLDGDGNEFETNAPSPLSGSADLCFISDEPSKKALWRGPVRRADSVAIY